ncbi:MAG TPA: hypothetical protein VMU68_14330 [Acidimicrobiales bacterium]|nr:hypothetical protein [Acidimicrobiales bacterium]
MKGTFGTFLGRALIVTAFTVSTIAWTGSEVRASTPHATPGQSTCDIVLNPSVRIVSKTPCVVQIRLGGNARLNLSTGFRWGNPTSTSRAVKVTSISRDSIGVFSAVLHAANVGRATIHDTGTESCKPGVMCPDLAILWTLRIVVTKTI